MCDQDPLLLENIVTGDETWRYQFDTKSKRQSMAWCSRTSPRQKKKKKKSRLQKSKVKTLLIAAFDQAVLNRFLQRIRRVKPELHRTGK